MFSIDCIQSWDRPLNPSLGDSSQLMANRKTPMAMSVWLRAVI